MSKSIFWGGFIFMIVMSFIDRLLGVEISASQSADGYSMSSCLMISGIGLKIMKGPD